MLPYGYGSGEASGLPAFRIHTEAIKGGEASGLPYPYGSGGGLSPDKDKAAALVTGGGLVFVAFRMGTEGGEGGED